MSERYCFHFSFSINEARKRNQDSSSWTRTSWKVLQEIIYKVICLEMLHYFPCPEGVIAFSHTKCSFASLLVSHSKLQRNDGSLDADEASWGCLFSFETCKSKFMLPCRSSVECDTGPSVVNMALHNPVEQRAHGY